MIFLFYILSTIVFAETTSNGLSVPFVDVKKQEMANAIAKIADDFDKKNSDLSCKKSSDCEALAMGHRKCGGPDYYLVISKKNKKAPQLRQLATKHQKMREEFLKIYQKGMMGICSVATKPNVLCTENKCAAQATE